MLPKYTVQYSVPFKKHAQTNHYSTDDPVACEQFLGELLDRGYRILEIDHEGVAVSRVDSDKLIKTAAGALAARRICASLNIKPEEAHFRFGFAV